MQEIQGFEWHIKGRERVTSKEGGTARVRGARDSSTDAERGGIAAR
jgi:hypothetical protein